jgi:hypothetical protein
MKKQVEDRHNGEEAAAGGAACCALQGFCSKLYSSTPRLVELPSPRKRDSQTSGWWMNYFPWQARQANAAHSMQQLHTMRLMTAKRGEMPVNNCTALVDGT